MDNLIKKRQNESETVLKEIDKNINSKFERKNSYFYERIDNIHAINLNALKINKKKIKIDSENELNSLDDDSG